MKEMSAKSDMEKAEKEIERLREFEITAEQADRELQEESARLDELENVKKSLSESRAGEARLRKAAQRMVDEWNIVASTVSKSSRGTPCGATKDFLDALSSTEPAEKFLNEERAKVWEEAAKCMDNQPGPVGPVSMAIWFRDRATACRNNLESKSGSAKGE